MYKIANHTWPCSMSSNAWGRSLFSSQPKRFPGAVFPWDFSPAQAYGRASLPGFCRCSAWCGHNLLEAGDSLYGTSKVGPRYLRNTKKFYESNSSTDVPEIFSYISSNMSRVEAAGFPGVSCSEKSLHPQILTRQTSKNRQFFTWGNPDVKLGEWITEKPLSCL